MRAAASRLLLLVAFSGLTLLLLEGAFRALGLEGSYPAPRIDLVSKRPGV